MLLSLGVALLAGVSTAAAQRPDGEAPSIFSRFNSEQAAPEAWQVLPEVPVFVQPQADPNAKIIQNRGLNLAFTFRPRNRVYYTRSYNLAQLEWEPRGSSVRRKSLTTFDISNLTNFSIKRVTIISLGWGLGLMDGLIRYNDGRFKTRLEPYVPLHIGLGFYPLEHWMISLRTSYAFFPGPGPVLSVTRGLIGIGYNY